MEKKRRNKRADFGNSMRKYGNLFLFYIPAAIFAILFSYLPLSGLVMAFKENPNLLGGGSPVESILKAGWVGFDNFIKIFSKKEFLNALRNTLAISLMKIVFVFPLPIALAILLNEMHGRLIKKTLQVSMYLPYFLSWATIGGIFLTLLNKDTGLVNNILEFFGHERVAFTTDNSTFRGVLILTNAWKDIGWSTITYLAAITALDRNQVEAAKIDGASKWQQIWYITLPGIMPVIATMLIIRLGYIMNAGFEQVYVFYSPYIQESGDILGTYTYRLVRESALIPQYALSTAADFFNSVVGLIMVLTGNFVSRKFFGKGVW